MDAEASKTNSKVDVAKKKSTGHIEARAIMKQKILDKEIDLDVIYQSLLVSKPLQVREKALADCKKLTPEVFKEWLDKWKGNVQGSQIEYDKLFEKLIKDVIKNYLHEKHEWVSIGVASYMTGDVTGLSIAAKISPNVTIKVIKGQKSNTELTAPSFYKNDKLPDSLSSLIGDGKLIIDDRDTGGKTDKYTSSVYGKKYNKHIGKSIKPWNKETYHATEIIGQQYKLNASIIKKFLLPSEGKDDLSSKKEKIENYRKSKFGDNKCILVWQRRSGANGGAHRELDSNENMLKQLLKMLTEAYKDRKIVLMGDKKVTTGGLDNIDESNIVELHEFWKDELDGEKVFNSREDQQYLLQLLSEKNDALSIGMRSGTLEASALLGVKTIFIDDLGNNAQGRMEFWAGEAAYNRTGIGIEDEKLFADNEKVNQGPLSNYKRFASLSQLGNVADGKNEEINDRVGAINNYIGRINGYEEKRRNAKKKRENPQDEIQTQNINNLIENINLYTKNYSKMDGIKAKDFVRKKEIDSFKEINQTAKEIINKLKDQPKSPTAVPLVTRVVMENLLAKFEEIKKVVYLNDRELGQMKMLVDYLLKKS